ncbi:MAG TPA: single-stranded-DNA-specific exonuclease RecJ, partial [Gemmataceae bacterium]
IGQLAQALRVSPVTAQLLLNRGVRDAAEARRFLDAPLAGLHPPALLPGVPDAADRLVRAARDGRRVCVYGDYDVDGTTGTAILLRLLRDLGADATYYLPNRLEEGYGLNRDALRQLKEAGVSLVVTVDCGIASVAEAEEARRLGLELIVTDHHEPKDRLPPADVLVHPRLAGGDYPFGGISGAAVAFKLAWAVAQQVSGGERVRPELREALMDALALATLGVVADVVPLADENRILVRHGLRRMRERPLLGVRLLMESARLNGAGPRAEDVSFRLAPRLNAAGRLGCARMVVELLTTRDPAEAEQFVAYLEQQNRTRQALERRITEQVRELVEAQDLAEQPALVLAGTDWHPGVIGIVAGRLVDLYARPVLLIAARESEPVAPGSGRSVPGFPLHAALAACEEDLLGHGGHAAAAGFKIDPRKVESFRRRFCDYAARHFPAGAPGPPRLMLDAEVPLSAVTFGLLRDLDRLEPYGAGNPRPRFLAGGLQVVGEPRRVGLDEKHLIFKVRQGETALRAVAFGMGERAEELMSAGGHCCLAFTPRLNEWNGSRTVELEVADFQPGPDARLE